MDYKKCIGEKVVRSDGVKGTIIDVSENGIKITYDDDPYKIGGTYMFDPFVSEHVSFEREDLQKEIDNIIREKEQEYESIIKEKTVSADKAKYKITLDIDSDNLEIIHLLDCDREEAFKVFGYVIKQQQREHRKANKEGRKFHWRIVRLFDCLKMEQIAQES